MDAAELHEVLSRYADHVRRFEEVASLRGRPVDQNAGAEVVPIQRYRDLEHELTKRELEVLRLIAEGHVRGLFAALRVNSRAQAVAVGFRRGMIS
jgi:DNA-binding CsgD family transcriptional regulator